MATDIEVARTFLTGCLAFLAILPSSLSITISYYRSELRKDKETWKSVRWYRRMVWAVIVTLWMIVAGYLSSLYVLLNLNSILQFPPSPTGLMTATVTTAILFLGVSFTLFAHYLFSADYNGDCVLYTMYDRDR